MPENKTYCCGKGKCLLDKAHPNSNNATYACDDECYLMNATEMSIKWYEDKYPEQFKECVENGTSTNK